MLGRLVMMCVAVMRRFALRPCVVRSHATCSAMSSGSMFFTPMGRRALFAAGHTMWHLALGSTGQRTAGSMCLARHPSLAVLAAA